MFAPDSIPAIFAVTQESFLVLAANVFALLSSVFVLCAARHDGCLVYLKPALAFIMVFIGVKCYWSTANGLFQRFVVAQY
ncbi:hypothetical protein O9992_28370 [Vibrio lentus]|nr:hypothetical protein [Vibrio lentus]